MVADLRWLIREHLGEDAEVLERDSAGARPPRRRPRAADRWPAARDVARRRPPHRARVVHAHNLHPSFGWRALAAARDAGARTVLHLHNYRLVCADGVCFTQGADCTRCHGRNTLPGVALDCRGGSRAEAVTYAAGLALSSAGSRRSADAFLVPSAFALQRLHDLGAPLGGRRTCSARCSASSPPHRPRPQGRFALAAGRLAPEKGFADAIDAARAAGLPLVVAGDGPQRDELERARAGPTSASPGGSPQASCGASRRGRRRDRALALRRDPPAGRARGDGRRPPRGGRRTGGLAEAVPPEGALRRPGTHAARRPPAQPVARRDAGETALARLARASRRRSSPPGCARLRGRLIHLARASVSRPQLLGRSTVPLGMMGDGRLRD